MDNEACFGLAADVLGNPASKGGPSRLSKEATTTQAQGLLGFRGRFDRRHWHPENVFNAEGKLEWEVKSFKDQKYVL